MLCQHRRGTCIDLGGTACHRPTSSLSLTDTLRGVRRVPSLQPACNCTPCPHRTISVLLGHSSGLAFPDATPVLLPPRAPPCRPEPDAVPALTDDGVVPLGEAGDELMSIGLPCSRVNLFVRGTQLPETDVLHDCRSKQDWFLGGEGGGGHRKCSDFALNPWRVCQEKLFWPDQDPLEGR